MVGRSRSLAAGAVLALAVAGLSWSAGVTVSRAAESAPVVDGGQQGDFFSDSGAISADGRYVAFRSFASNLVPNDINGTGDVFVRDRRTGETTRVSVAGDGSQADNASLDPDISADGRYVAFASLADNLVPGDTNGQIDVFVNDRRTGVTTRVSVAGDGSQADGLSGNAAISGDGRYVAFLSTATNLVSGDTNYDSDVFVRDTRNGTTSRVSVGPGGVQADALSLEPAISADGRYVAFVSVATNLVTADTNGQADLFVRDLRAATTTRVSVSDDGTQADNASGSPALSGDGRFVAFSSAASNLVAADTNGVDDVFVHDRRTGTITRVSVATGGAQGDSTSGPSAISDDGRYVAFSSDATNIVSGDTNGVGDIFVRDRKDGVTIRASVASDGSQGNGPSFGSSVSAHGRDVAFDSIASNLVLGDTNNESDVFTHDPKAGTTSRVSVGSAGS